ncbi:IS91 family transposase [Noviherbaspirillum saxi]|uniref:IS91 family transposase n=1 Tax=Noviherbaspirillum saxi TaxID=2320863 RepID=A0A3A3FJM0_9BURK|nr:IS91 family transposase [Noviherbaspirillum saxi]RJF95264.1 IS91 family transposase [Noviherbaspirillum saxi]RJF95693.1 IS91 family transposase [Noviherbaspirillum saxi]
MAGCGRTELADIFRLHGQGYLATHALARSQAKAWRAIVSCRTPALGGHVDQCAACGTTRHVYHSCRNRHCPRCQTRAKEQWIANRHRELLPVPYTHLVFTIPHALNGVASHHFRAITDILFASAAATLTAFGGNPRWLGGKLAFSLVLHTWSQSLMRHLHVHALVASGALTPDGQWVSSRRGFLFPVKALSKVFRGKFIDALTQAREQGRLNQDANTSDAAWRQLLRELRRHDWVVYAKQPLGGPAQVLEYLARYTHRVAISHERLVSMANGTVAFRVRDNANPGKKRIERLPAQQFIGRFLLHVLPLGFKRIRHYGILASVHKHRQLARCRQALAAPEPDAAIIETVDAFLRRVTGQALACCPHCGQPAMRLMEVVAPSRWHACSTGPP